MQEGWQGLRRRRILTWAKTWFRRCCGRAAFDVWMLLPSPTHMRTTLEAWPLSLPTSGHASFGWGEIPTWRHTIGFWMKPGSLGRGSCGTRPAMRFHLEPPRSGCSRRRTIISLAAFRPNNDSLVLRVSYGKTSALLEGDAEAPSEARMIAAGGLKSDLLKAGHHGSKTSTTPTFLAAVSPSYSAISVGRRNFYGHPRHEVLEELQAAHVATYRTDMLGLTSFYLDGEHVTARPCEATRY